MPRISNLIMYALAIYTLLFVVSAIFGGDIKGTLTNSTLGVLLPMFPYVAMVFFGTIAVKLFTHMAAKPETTTFEEPKSVKKVVRKKLSSSHKDEKFWLAANIIGIIGGVPILFLMDLGMKISGPTASGPSGTEHFFGYTVPFLGIVFSVICLLTYFVYDKPTKSTRVLMFPFVYLFFAVLCVVATLG